MKELFKKWNELEPDVCTVSMQAGGYVYRAYGYAAFYTYFDCLGDGGDERSALIQYAVQQAIEARGWFWAMPNIAHGYKYQSVILVNDEYEGLHNESPAHALISAYLQALEAVKEESADG